MTLQSTTSRATALPGTSTRRRRWPAAVAVVLVVAALTVVGVAGLSRYVSGFWLYRGFAPPATPHSVVVKTASGTRRVAVAMPSVQSFSVASRALSGYLDQVQVVLPPGYSAHPHLRYPVLYLLHGFPGVPSGFVNIGRVVSIEATLVAEGRMKPLILVMPSGTRSFLADTEWANGIGRGNAWDTFVARDLVHAIDARYRTIAVGAARGIGGLSEGGYGALNIGLHHPGEFSLLESWSGYMTAFRLRPVFGTGTSMLGYNSPAAWIRSVSAQVHANHTYIWFYSGRSDPLAAQNRAFAAELGSLGIAHHFYTMPGRHTWGLWRSQMALALITASEHLHHV
jgi:enterochelin esterase-like enzyme